MVMGDHQQGSALVLAVRKENVQDLVPIRRVQVGCGFIAQQEGGSGNQGPANGHPLAFSLGEFPGVAGHFVVQPYLLQQFTGAFPLAVPQFQHRIQPIGQEDIFIGIQILQQFELLKNEAEADDPKILQIPITVVRKGDATDLQLPLVGFEDPGKQMDKGRFSTAAGACECHPLARGDLQLGYIQPKIPGLIGEFQVFTANYRALDAITSRSSEINVISDIFHVLSTDLRPTVPVYLFLR